jgi:hypothetical protein
MRWLRREIERTYPGAAIQGLEKPNPNPIKMKDKSEKEPTPKAKTSDSNEKL